MTCIQPLTLADRIVPCGKCYHCKLNRVNGWVLRLQEEQKVSDSSYFVTLTYENEKNDPESNCARHTKSGRHTLVKRDLQLYFKRLRKLSAKHGRNTIKYYAVGEYGSKSRRPHYHAIIFGAEKMDIRAKWLHGFVHVGTVTSNSIAYCLKYIAKGRTVPENNDDDRQKEFSVMSQQLGTAYLTDAMLAYHRAQPIERGNSIRPGGYKFPLPRYFKERIFTSDQKAQIAKYYEDLYLEDFIKNHVDMSHAEWQAEKKFIKERIVSSYNTMEYLSKQNEKI